MFYVGQKVVCIDNTDQSKYLSLAEVYTIRAIYKDFEGYLRVKLNEIKFDVDKHGWYAKRFRPIVDAKAEVSFTIGADPDSDKWDNRKVKVK